MTNSQYVEFLNAKDPNGSSPLQLYNSNMVRPERRASRKRGESCCVRLAGVSPVAVGAGMPRSRSQKTSESLASERDVESPQVALWPLGGERVDGPNVK